MEKIEIHALMGHWFLNPYHWIKIPCLVVIPYLALISKLWSLISEMPHSVPFDQSYCSTGLRMVWGQKSSLEATCTLVAAVPSQILILHQLGVQVGEGGSVVVKKDPFETKFHFCWVLCLGGIKLQFLYCFRIGLTVESLPYPGSGLEEFQAHPPVY